MLSSLSLALKLANQNIEKSQTAWKHQYDHSSKGSTVKSGDRVMEHMPAELKGRPENWNWPLPSTLCHPE